MIQTLKVKENLESNQTHKVTLPTQNLSPNVYFVKIKKDLEVIDIQTIYENLT